MGAPDRCAQILIDFHYERSLKNMSTTIEITRNELCQRVWLRPVTNVVRELGISDSAVARLAGKFNTDNVGCVISCCTFSVFVASNCLCEGFAMALR